MRGKLFLFASIYLFNLACISSSRTFVPKGGPASRSWTEHSSLSLQTTLSSDKVALPFGGAGAEERNDEADEFKEVSRIGSSPPSCEHKCFGCMPCEAIQVPTTNNRVGVQYANYEPEGWKCKCGPTLYTP